MAASNSLNMDTSGVQTYNATTGGLDGSAMTQYLVVCGDANNKIQNVAAIGSSGQVLTSNGAGTLPTFQDAGGGGGGSSTAGSIIDLVDDFIGLTTADSSQLGWNGLTAVIGGVGNAQAVDGTLGRVGIIALSTSTSATGSYGYGLGFFSSSSEPIVLGAGTLTMQFWLKIPTLSTGSERFYVTFGLNNASDMNPFTQTNSVSFRYIDSENSGKWTIKTVASSSPTSSNTNSTADTDWHVYKIVVNADASSIAFYIDGVEVTNSPITTTIPSAAIAPYIVIQKSIGTTARTVEMDLFTLNYDLTTPR